MRWTVHGERSLYDSEWVRLVLTDVELPSGARFEHHVVRMPAPAAGVDVQDPDHDGVLLLWRHRFTTDTWGWEVPAGRVDAGESPADAGARETLEETGWRPGPLRRLTTYFPYNGVSDGAFHLFWPTARSTSATPTTPTRPSASSGCRGPTSSPRSTPAASATASR